tara:strand:- start:953 stop:1108 length:156 start_codon:yes stop_codon:yes gene_type:complete
MNRMLLLVKKFFNISENRLAKFPDNYRVIQMKKRLFGLLKNKSGMMNEWKV